MNIQDTQEYKVTVEEGTTRWFNENGKLHRIEGPAIEYADGGKVWLINGRRHREDGPAVESADGEKLWYIDGKSHRIGGPAVIESRGTKMWFVEGELHREDGPAIEWPTGANEWYLNGRNVTEEEFNTRMNSLELTLEDIAKKFGVSVEQIKIKR